MAGQPPVSVAKPGVQHRAATAPAAGGGGAQQFPDGWTAYAQWLEDPTHVITSMTTTWTVPPPPENVNDGQLIYLFNGLEDCDAQTGKPNHILQPVLAWGISPDGGGPYWSVASWYYFAGKERGFKSPSVRVNKGDTLTGVMKLTGQSGSQFNYSCEFAGIANTTLHVVGVDQLMVPVITLECSGITTQQDYPDTVKTTMRAIDVATAAGSIDLAFVELPRAATGQHAKVQSPAKGAGVVDLFYSGAES